MLGLSPRTPPSSEAVYLGVQRQGRIALSLSLSPSFWCIWDEPGSWSGETPLSCFVFSWMEVTALRLVIATFLDGFPKMYGERLGQWAFELQVLSNQHLLTSLLGPAEGFLGVPAVVQGAKKIVD